MSNEQKTEEQIIELWKKLDILNVTLEFNCGGDSMGEMDWTIHTQTGTIDNQEIKDYFDEQVFNKVDFYVNSDGHYQGEAGEVIIELDEEDKDFAHFTYSKQAESEFSEAVTNELYIQLNDKEAEFIKQNILNFNGDDSEINSVFKGDLFLTDDDETFLDELEEKILDEVRDFSPETDEGELEEWLTFNTEEDNITITDDNKLVVEVTNRIRVFRESE